MMRVLGMRNFEVKDSITNLIYKIIYEITSKKIMKIF